MIFKHNFDINSYYRLSKDNMDGTGVFVEYFGYDDSGRVRPVKPAERKLKHTEVTRVR